MKGLGWRPPRPGFNGEGYSFPSLECRILVECYFLLYMGRTAGYIDAYYTNE